MISGYLYILLNPGLAPGFCKIGMTMRRPEDRARELSDKSGLPAAFVVAYEEPVGDVVAAEHAVHDRLATYRVSGDRESFPLDLKVAIAIVAEVAKGFPARDDLPLLVRLQVRGVYPPSETTLTIFAGGRVVLLTGRPSNGAAVPAREWTIPLGAIKRILSSLERCHFLDLNASYRLGRTDYPIETIEAYLPDGTLKRVEIGYEPGEIAPEELQAATEEIWLYSGAAERTL